MKMTASLGGLAPGCPAQPRVFRQPQPHAACESETATFQSPYLYTELLPLGTSAAVCRSKSRRKGRTGSTTEHEAYPGLR